MPVPTLAERIGKSFAAWERRGRGWQVAEYAVSLEPPFRPFFLLPGPEPTKEQIDDGRHPPLWSKLFDAAKTAFSGPKEPQTAPAFEEQAPFEAYRAGPFVTRRIVVPADWSEPMETATHLLRAVALGYHPVSFELVGSAGAVTIQVACSELDAERVFESIADYAPDATALAAEDLLSEPWASAPASLVVDWGLSEEFFLPLATYGSFRLDPYIPLVSALARAREGEALCFQVLIEPVRNPWRKAILHAVAPDGSPLFSDAPEFVPGAKEKTQSPLFACVVRTAACANDPSRALDLIRGTTTFTSQFSREGGNALIPLDNEEYSDKAHKIALLARVSFRTGMILSLSELVGLAHVPDASVQNPALARLAKHTKALPAIAKEHSLVLGENVHRGVRVPVTLGTTERLAHTMIVGASGTGKSTLLVNMIRQDIECGEGVLVLDPHGDLIDDVLARIPPDRADHVILFDPSDEDFPVGFNVLDAESERERILLASDLVAIFARLSTSWGDTMGTVLSNAVIAMLESREGGTLLHLRRFLIDQDYRNTFLNSVHDDEVLFFWKKEWPLIGARSIGPILTRLNAFLRPRLIRHIVGQRRPRLRLPYVMLGRKIFLAKLSQGLIGNENAYLLGSLILSRFLQLALARQATAKEARQPFWIYLDEAEHFVTPSVAALVTGARKYSVGMTLAFQMLSQLRSVPQVEQAVLGNAHTRIVFRVGDDDARRLADGFSAFNAQDLRNLGCGEAIARIGAASQDFNLRTALSRPVSDGVATERRLDIQNRSREAFAVPVAVVSAELALLRETAEPEPANGNSAEAPAANVRKPIEPPASPPLPVSALAPNRTRAQLRSEIPLLGKGGPEHKYLQYVIKKLSTERGFRAEIEKPLSEGQVDVALHREGLSIACEVSATTGTEHELANIRKCLGAGFSQVWLIISDTKRRSALAKAIGKLQNPAVVRCLGIEDLPDALDACSPALQATEQMVGGYKVKVTRGSSSPTDAAQRRSAIAEVLARSVMKQKKPTKVDPHAPK